MEDFNFVAGQEFPDVKAFRNAIKEAAIAQHFELRVIKSDLMRYSAKCAADDCPWQIRAVKLPSAPTFTIRSLETTHTCGKTAQNGHHQASVDWIVKFIEERLRNDTNYKPKDILHDIQKQYGITIPYKQAWRAKERGLAVIFGSFEEGYSLLPSYCQQLKISNPGSFAEVFTSEVDNQFHCLFVSFHASILGFLHGCLPILGLGGIQLKSKYLGTLLSATSFDADGELFPVAFGIVDVHNDDTWEWFLSELHKALEINNTKGTPLCFTFLSHGQRGIVDAIRTNFPGSAHAFCVGHLSELFGKEFNNSRLAHLLYKAAYSTTTMVFKEKMTEIELVSSDAAKWLDQFPPSHWALVYSDRMRYGCLSSNIEEFNGWVLEAQQLPMVQVVECIHRKLMTEFEERRSKCSAWTSVLAPSAENRISESIFRASNYQVLRSNEVEFEVISSERSDIVDIGRRTCSCRGWQLYGIPCSHAVAALMSCKKDVYAFTEKCFTVDSYCIAYSESINPISGKVEEWKKVGEGSEGDAPFMVRPPKVRRPPGRPERKRICLEVIGYDKHTVHCSLCNQTGHYKTTCKAETMNRTEQF